MSNNPSICPEIEERRKELFEAVKVAMEKGRTELSLVLKDRRVYTYRVRLLRRSGPYGVVDYVGDGYVLARFDAKGLHKFLRLGRGLTDALLDIKLTGRI